MTTPRLQPFWAAPGSLLAMAFTSLGQVTSLWDRGLPVVHHDKAAATHCSEVVWSSGGTTPYLMRDQLNPPVPDSFPLTTIRAWCHGPDGLKVCANSAMEIMNPISTEQPAARPTHISGEAHGGYELGFHGLYPPSFPAELSSKGPYDFFTDGLARRQFLPSPNTVVGVPHHEGISNTLQYAGVAKSSPGTPGDIAWGRDHKDKSQPKNRKFPVLRGPPQMLVIAE